MSGRFADRTAVITGAGGTLCSAMAIELARQGARVALLGRSLASLETVAATITTAGGSAQCVPVDVTDAAAITEAADLIADTLGPCRILINGAGGKLPGSVTSQTAFTPAELDAHGDERGFLNADLEIFRREVDLNLMGTVIPSQIFARPMARAGGGAIITMASMASFRPLSKIAPYAAAKAAVVSFTQWLAAYLAPAGIRVNAIAPGFFLNERSRTLLFDQDGKPSERGAQVLHHTPLGRFGEPAELLGCMNWLLDDQAAGFTTGITVPVDGGFLACPGT
ncbi:MAG: SDR family NAD(P)-dependent oxidoreductase [Planctomycetota bacterium]